MNNTALQCLIKLNSRFKRDWGKNVNNAVLWNSVIISLDHTHSAYLTKPLRLSDQNNGQISQADSSKQWSLNSDFAFHQFVNSFFHTRSLSLRSRLKCLIFDSLVCINSEIRRQFQLDGVPPIPFGYVSPEVRLCFQHLTERPLILKKNAIKIAINNNDYITFIKAHKYLNKRGLQAHRCNT